MNKQERQDFLTNEAKSFIENKNQVIARAYFDICGISREELKGYEEIWILSCISRPMSNYETYQKNGEKVFGLKTTFSDRSYKFEIVTDIE